MDPFMKVFGMMTNSTVKEEKSSLIIPKFIKAVSNLERPQDMEYKSLKKVLTIKELLKKENFTVKDSRYGKKGQNLEETIRKAKRREKEYSLGKMAQNIQGP